MKLAFLYAGQGSQKTGMGRDLYEGNEAFRQTWDRANACLDFDLNTAAFENPEDMLLQTRYTQSALLAFAAGVTEALKEQGIQPQAAAGLSLGEYSALYGAGCFDLETAVNTVALRGRVMEQAAQGMESAMVAVLGMEREELQQVCLEAGKQGVVEICNDNCPGQIVISGEKEAVEKAAALAKERGAKRCMPLKVSGPFHTSLMAPAGDALKAHFQTIRLSEPKIPVYFNCKGGRKEAGEDLGDLLVRQVQTGVRFRESLLAMERDGVDTVLEIGPGKTLSGFVKKTAPNMKIYQVETLCQLEEFVKEWKGAAQ